MSLLNPKLKWLFVIGLILCLGLLAYFAFLKNSKPDNSKSENAATSTKLITTTPEVKPTAYKENLDQQAQLKTLEFKLSEARTKHEKLLHLCSVIEARIKLRQDLLKPAQDRLARIQNLQKEGALNDQDVELARSQLVAIESSIEKARQDKEKVGKLISNQEAEVSKAEAEIKKIKSL